MLVNLGIEAEKTAHAVEVSQTAMEGVLDHGEAVDQVVVLEDHAHFAALGAQGGAAEARHVLAVHQHFAVGGRDEVVDQAQEGGLTGARGADDGDEFAGGDV